MEQHLNRIEDSYHEDPARQQGVGRLAIHCAFEYTMRKHEAGEMTRAEAIDTIARLRPLVLRNLGIVEVAE